MAKEKKNNGLHFRGRPDGLEVLVPHVLEHATMRLHVEKAEAAAPVHLDVQHEPVGNVATFLRITLPESTPPGKYAATVRYNDGEHAATVEVEAAPHLELSPTQLGFVVNPGETVSAELTIVGGGNVPVTIPHVNGVGVFEVGGLEDALAAVYRDHTVKGLDRWGKLADELAKRHALARVVIKEGETTIAPGQIEHLTVEMRWPKTMRTGRTYAGTWPIAANLRLSVQVEVSGARDTKEAIDD